MLVGIGFFIIIIIVTVIAGSLINSKNNRAASGSAAYVNTKTLNIRSGPGVENGVIATLNQGASVTRYETAQSSNGATWAKIRSGSYDGWVNTKHLSDAPVETSKVQPQNNASSIRQDPIPNSGNSLSWEGIKGSIGPYKIVMNFSIGNGKFTGHYSYAGKTGQLRLEGSYVDKGISTVYEYDANQNLTGIFEFKNYPVESNSGSVFKGTWTSGDRKRSFPFQLESIGD